MSLVELARYANPYEAELDRGRLESAGIHAFCFDGHMNIFEGFSFAIPVRLMVLDIQRDEAAAVLSADVPGGSDG